jgi:hypothetical protein
LQVDYLSGILVQYQKSDEHTPLQAGIPLLLLISCVHLSCDTMAHSKPTSIVLCLHHTDHRDLVNGKLDYDSLG